MADIRYQTTLEGVGPDQLTGFFKDWPNPPSPVTLHRILHSAFAFVVALDERDEVVGFVNAISDGILCAYIPLLEVRADYQGKGIGSELIRLLVAELEVLYMIDTSCDDALVPFYERFGMFRGNAMVLRNYAAQSGKG